VIAVHGAAAVDWLGPSIAIATALLWLANLALALVLKRPTIRALLSATVTIEFVFVVLWSANTDCGSVRCAGSTLVGTLAFFVGPALLAAAFLPGVIEGYRLARDAAQSPAKRRSHY
jgi:hypothetical protein